MLSLNTILSRTAAVLALALTLGVALAPRAAQAQQIEVVTNTNDSGTGSLRAAINTLNNGSGTPADTIKFNISGGPTHTIQLQSTLPVISDPLVIDGTTDGSYPNTSSNGPVTDGPVVRVDGDNLPSGDDIFQISASDSKIRGLALTNAQDEAIQVNGSDFVVADCFVGLGLDGTTQEGNSEDPIGNATAIYVSRNNVTVANNVISGNAENGILLNASDAFVRDNIVGLDFDGDAAENNGDNGIVVEGDDNLIGNTFNPIIILGANSENNQSKAGTQGLFGNVISGNSNSGIIVRGDNNEVLANVVGADIDGTTAIGNGNNGINVSGTGGDPAQGNLIGDDGAGNLISGNDGRGINLGVSSQGRTSLEDTVRANVIGLSADSSTALPNGNDTDVDGGIIGSLAEGAVIDSNMVAGNNGQGIILFNGDADIIDNIVGTNRSFATGLGNSFDGIQVKPSPSSNTDETQVVENIVGNNDNDGIDIRGSHHDVADNYVGVAPDGSDIGNGSTDQGRGIVIDNGSSTLTDVAVGAFNNPGNGLAAGFSTPNGAGNVIGNNLSDGILVRGQASGIDIEENYVGTNPSGTDLGNGSGANDGIRIVESGHTITDIVVGYEETNSFSSPHPADGGQGNVVAFNAGDGISVGSNESTNSVTDITVRGNSVFQNGAANDTNIGIDLGNSGQTSNDAGDSDSGPNGLQNFPNITNVSHSSQQVTIDYEVKTNDTGSNYPLTVDFYAADSEQSGEGKIYLGSQDYTSANTTASVSFDLSTVSNVNSDDYFVATATDANGNTSEFFGPLAEQLPVELASFEATQSGNRTTTLRWSTASERNNAGFRVQHQGPKAASWSKLGFVEGNGTTTTAQSYRFDAENLSVGTHRFRLQQVDLDGSTTLHDPVTVDLEMTKALRLSAPAPNPVHGTARASFAVKDEVQTQVTLYNVLGKQVKTLYRGTPTGGEAKSLRIRTSDLASGVYFLRLQADGQSRTERLTVVR